MFSRSLSCYYRVINKLRKCFGRDHSEIDYELCPSSKLENKFPRSNYISSNILECKCNRKSIVYSSIIGVNHTISMVIECLDCQESSILKNKDNHMSD